MSGFPPQDKINEWKKEFREVFSIEAAGRTFVYRALTFSEFEEIILIAGNEATSVDLEDGVINTALLWPEELNLDRESPGLISTISGEIQSTSCVDGDVYGIKNYLDEARVKASGYRGEMYSFILMAMPQYKLEDLGDYTLGDLAFLVAMAEKVIHLKMLSEGMQIDQPFRLQIYTEDEIAELNSAKVSDKGNATVTDPIAQKLMEAM